MVGIAGALGIGSGIDTAVVIDALVKAQREPREAALTRRADRVEARISGLAQLRSGISALRGALAARVGGGALGMAPASSDSAVVEVARAGAGPSGAGRSEIEVRRLARAQTLTAAALPAGAPVGRGTLTLTVGTMSDDGQGGFAFAGGAAGPVDIVIDAANDGLAGLRDAINAAQADVRASIVADDAGGRLVLKGATGAASAFILTAAGEAGDTGLDRFVYKPGTTALTLAARAADAEVAVDGIVVTRPGNTIDDLLDGVRLTLRAERPGAPVTVAADANVTGMVTALDDLVAAINELDSLAGGLTQAADRGSGAEAGPLSGDGTVRRLRQQLRSLVAGPTGSGFPARLSDLGIATGRDGRLTLDTAQATRVAAAAPQAVEAMLAALVAAGGAGTPRGGLRLIEDGLAAGGPLSSAARLDREAEAVTRERAALDERMTRLRSQLERQYAAMDVIVAGFKSTQSFIEQQVKLWTQSDN